MLPTKPYFWTPPKVTKDQIFMRRNKDAIMARVAELCAGDELVLGAEKSDTDRKKFGRYYHKAAQQVKDDIGEDGMEEYAEEARRYRTGNVPVDVQEK
jgi:hypothetical protein